MSHNQTVTKKETVAAQDFVREHIAHDELEINETLPVRRAGDGTGVWVPMLQFVRFNELTDYLS